MEIDLFIDRHWFTYKKGDSLLRFRADKFYHVECWDDDDEAMDDDAYYDLKEEVIEALDDFEPCIIYFGDDNETYRITDLPEFLEQTSDGSETILNNRQLKSVEEAVDFIKNLKTVAFGEIEHLLVPLPKKEKWSEKRVKFNNGQLLRLIVDLHDGDFAQTLLSYGKLENWDTSEVTDIELKAFVMSLYHHFTLAVSKIFWLAQAYKVPDKELIKEEIERHKEELLPKSITLFYYHELSKFLIKKDYVSEAISMLEKELRLENIEYYKSYYYTLANAYFSLKNYDKALHYCDIIINSDPSDINAYETYILRSQTKMILSDNSDEQEDIAFAEKIKERYDELQVNYDEMRLYLSDYLWEGEDIKNSWDQNNIEVSLLSPDHIRFFHELYGNLNDGKKAKGQINEQGAPIKDKIPGENKSNTINHSQEFNGGVDDSELEIENSVEDDEKTSFKYYVIYTKNIDWSNVRFVVFEIIDLSFIVHFLLSKKYGCNPQELLKTPKDYFKTALKLHLIAEGDLITNVVSDVLPDNPFEPTEKDLLGMELSDFNEWTKRHKDKVKRINLNRGNYLSQTAFRLKDLNQNESFENIALIDELYYSDVKGTLLSKIVRCDTFEPNIVLNYSVNNDIYFNRGLSFLKSDFERQHEENVRQHNLDIKRDFVKSILEKLKNLGITYDVGLEDFDDFILFYTIIHNSRVFDLIDSDSYDYWKRYKNITKLNGEKWSLPFLDRTDFILYLSLIKKYPEQKFDDFFKKKVCKYCQSATPEGSDVCQFCLYEEKINDFDLLPDTLKGDHAYYEEVVAMNARIRDLQNMIKELQRDIKSGQENSEKWYYSSKKNTEIYKAKNIDKFQRLDDMKSNLEKTIADRNRLFDSEQSEIKTAQQNYSIMTWLKKT